MAAVIVDTNILLDVYTQDVTWAGRSEAALAAAAERATLAINPIIYGELSVRFSSIEELDEFLGNDFRRDALPWEAAFLAGRAFVAYRRRGGAKHAPLPDFYIGAHAAVRDMQILTRDPHRYATYFPRVRIFQP